MLVYCKYCQVKSVNITNHMWNFKWQHSLPHGSQHYMTPFSTCATIKLSYEHTKRNPRSSMMTILDPKVLQKKTIKTLIVIRKYYIQNLQYHKEGEAKNWDESSPIIWNCTSNKKKTFDALPIVTLNIWHKGFVSVIAWQVSWQSKSCKHHHGPENLEVWEVRVLYRGIQAYKIETKHEKKLTWPGRLCGKKDSTWRT